MGGIMGLRPQVRAVCYFIYIYSNPMYLKSINALNCNAICKWTKMCGFHETFLLPSFFGVKMSHDRKTQQTFSRSCSCLFVLLETVRFFLANFTPVFLRSSIVMEPLLHNGLNNPFIHFLTSQIVHIGEHVSNLCQKLQRFMNCSIRGDNRTGCGTVDMYYWGQGLFCL